MSGINTVIAVDTSGSVRGNEYYWAVVRYVLTQVQRDTPVNELMIVLWNSEASYSLQSISYLMVHVEGLEGFGGTNPCSIIPCLLNVFSGKVVSRFYLITDGEVDQYSVTHLDQLIEQHGITFGYCECHIVNRSIDLSVTCPFTRQSASQVYTHSNQAGFVRSGVASASTVILSFTASDWVLLDRLETIGLEEFLQSECYEKLKSLLLAKNIGRAGMPQQKEQLIRLKTRLVKEYSSRPELGANYLPKRLEDLLTTSEANTSDALNVASLIAKKYHEKSDLRDIIVKLDTLINLCGVMTNQFRPGDIMSNAYNRAEGTVESTPEVHLYEVLYKPVECPVMYEEDCPCILVNYEYSSVLADLPKETVEFITDCPLRLLLQPDLVEKTKKWISRSIGLKTGWKLYESKEANPFTRGSIEAIIPLGMDPSHIAAADWAIAKIFTGGKRMGQMDLWMVVLSKIFQQIEYLQEVQESVRQFVEYRLKTGTTFASLSKVGTMVTTPLRVREALWWVLSCATEQVSKEIPSRDNPIRFHLPHISIIIDLVRSFVGDFAVTEEMTHTIERYKLMARLMAFAKEHPGWIEHAKQMIYQRCLFVGDLHPVLLDGPQENINKVYEYITERVGWKNLSSFTPSELYSILSAIDPNKQSGDIVYREVPLPSPVVKWTYLDIPTDSEAFKSCCDYRVPICYSTFRPYSTYREVYNGEEAQVAWRESANRRWNVSDESVLFPGTKLFLTYIQQHMRIPSDEDYIRWCERKIKLSLRYGKDWPLPDCIRELYQSVYNDYREVFARASEDRLCMPEIARRIALSSNLAERVKMEKTSEPRT